MVTSIKVAIQVIGDDIIRKDHDLCNPVVASVVCVSLGDKHLS